MKSIRQKISIPMIILAVIPAIAVLVACIIQFNNYVGSAVESELLHAADTLSDYVENNKSVSLQGALYIAGDGAMSAAVANGDRQAVLLAGKSLMAASNVEFCTITDAAGTVIARCHEPDNFGDSVKGQKNISSALGGKPATFIEAGTAVKLSVRSGAPVYGPDGEIIGAVSVGFRLDQSAFVDRIKAITGSEVTIFLGDERVSTTVKNADGTRAVGTKANEDVSRTVLGGSQYKGTAQVLDRDATVHYRPLTEGGTVVGMLFVGKYLDISAAAQRGFMITGIIVCLISAIVAGVISFLLARRIVAPVLTLVDAGDRIAKGDLDITFNVTTKDELKNLADSFNRVITANKAQAVVIDALSRGDLTMDVSARSDNDAVGRALIHMLETNNEAFSHIITSAQRVGDSAKDIASGADSLAEGSTEQAAAVEQLSAAISDVSEKARQNSDLADQGAKLGDDIMAGADRGAEQMRRMSDAVRDINSASRAIETVIKTIDDIAFQTNLLALNASVEAARAGQHGKGFAVVADEVRSLASKSAEAAKSTGELIENSISKAQLGAAIAKETADSLNEIVNGVRQSSQILSSIASASNEQSDALRQIRQGVEDVARVVQTNNATAQESAAASALMSAESDTLQSLVSHFRLKEQPRYLEDSRY